MAKKPVKNEKLIELERKLKFYEINDEIFKSGLTVITGKAEVYHDYILERYDHDFKVTGTEQGRYHHLTKEKDNLNHFIIWLPTLKVKDMLTLIHEVGHFVFDLLANERGVPHTNDTDEVYEYYREYILKLIFAKAP